MGFRKLYEATYCNSSLAKKKMQDQRSAEVDKEELDESGEYSLKLLNTITDKGKKSIGDLEKAAKELDSKWKNNYKKHPLNTQRDMIASDILKLKGVKYDSAL